MKGPALRVGDLVTYGLFGSPGVFLGETHHQWYENADTHYEFYNVTRGRVSETLGILGLLSRLALPDDPHPTPARGDPR